MHNTAETFFFDHIMTGVLSMQGVDLGLHVAETTRLLDGNLPTVSLFSRYKPQKDWFNPHTEDWHGVAHATRVSVCTELLSRILIKQGMNLDVEALRWGAPIHDVGRKHDGYDWIHGAISAGWASKNLKGLLPDASLDVLRYIVEWHAPEDDEAPQMTPELAVLKDADAMDRARVRHAYVNPSELRCAVSKSSLAYIAHGLLVESKKIELDFEDKFGAVMQAGMRIGIIQHTPLRSV